jgi:hypothetical protein
LIVLFAPLALSAVVLFPLAVMDEGASIAMDAPAVTLAPEDDPAAVVIIEGAEIVMLDPLPVANSPLAEVLVIVEGLEIVMDPTSSPEVFA